MYPKLYYMSGVSRVDGVYGVYVDITKFHPLGTSPLLWFVSSTHRFLSRGWLVYCTWGMVYYLLVLWWNNVVTMQFPWSVKPLLTDMKYTTFAKFHKYPLCNKTTISLSVEGIKFSTVKMFCSRLLWYIRKIKR